jgi:5-methylcytosine-specific restriction endonuclease McrA
MAKPGLNGWAYRKLRAYMKEHYPWICHRCTQPISREITATNPRHPMAWSADHWPVPRSHGGPTELANLQPAHITCNSEAGNQIKDDANPTSQDWGV